MSNERAVAVLKLGWNPHFQINEPHSSLRLRKEFDCGKKKNWTVFIISETRALHSPSPLKNNKRKNCVSWQLKTRAHALHLGGPGSNPITTWSHSARSYPLQANRCGQTKINNDQASAMLQEKYYDSVNQSLVISEPSGHVIYLSKKPNSLHIYRIYIHCKSSFNIVDMLQTDFLWKQHLRKPECLIQHCCWEFSFLISFVTKYPWMK